METIDLTQKGTYRQLIEKTKKQFFTIVCCLFAAVNTFGATSYTITGSGADLILTITGTGNMPNYNNSSYAPWNGQGSSIKTVIIEDGVTRIGNYAFNGCWSLTSVTIPNSVTTIGGEAFSDCVGLTSVTFGNSLTAIGMDFYGCTGLTSITFGNSMNIIGSRSFYGCTGLTGTLTIPNSVTTIGQEAFYGCTGLTSLIIGNSVTDIENQAFANCTDLMEINSQNTTPPGVWDAFDGKLTKNPAFYMFLLVVLTFIGHLMDGESFSIYKKKILGSRKW